MIFKLLLILAYLKKLKMSIYTKINYVFLGVSHCADFYPSSSSDLPQLTKARKTVLYNLKKWLSENDN